MLTRRRLLIAACTLVLTTLLVLSPLLVIRIDTSGHLSDNPAAVSHHQVAIVLGAGLDETARSRCF
jgi:vancomycin permeability regulator SanA